MPARLATSFSMISRIPPPRRRAGNQPPANETSVIPDPGDGFSNPGIIFSVGGFLVFPGETMDATITYTIATLSGSSVIQGYDLTMAGSHTAAPTGLGSGSVTESFSNAPAGTPLTTTVGPLGSNFECGQRGFSPLGRQHYQSPPRSTCSRPGDSGPFDIVTISAIQEHFSENVPEPYETLLIGSGLLFFGLWRKRVRQ